MANNLPKLEVIPINKLILHEEADSKRIERLTKRIKRDGCFKNPIIVAKFNKHDSQFLVLDGVHRAKALEKLGCRDVIGQVVNYFDEGVKVYTWAHLLFGGRQKELLGKIRRIRGLKLIKADKEKAERLLKGKRIVGYFLLKDGNIFLLRSESGLKVRTEKLGEVVRACEAVSEVSRLLKNEIEHLLKKHNDAFAVLVVPTYNKKDILKLTLNGLKIPAGVTRHIIPNRVLGFNIGLSILKKSSSLDNKNEMLRKFIEQKIKDKKIRLYPESVFVFDE